MYKIHSLRVALQSRACPTMKLTARDGTGRATDTGSGYMSWYDGFCLRCPEAPSHSGGRSLGPAPSTHITKEGAGDAESVCSCSSLGCKSMRPGLLLIRGSDRDPAWQRTGLGHRLVNSMTLKQQNKMRAAFLVKMDFKAYFVKDNGFPSAETQRNACCKPGLV